MDPTLALAKFFFVCVGSSSVRSCEQVVHRNKNRVMNGSKTMRVRKGKAVVPMPRVSKPTIPTPDKQNKERMIEIEEVVKHTPSRQEQRGEQAKMISATKSNNKNHIRPSDYDKLWQELSAIGWTKDFGASSSSGFALIKPPPALCAKEKEWVDSQRFLKHLNKNGGWAYVKKMKARIDETLSPDDKDKLELQKLESRAIHGLTGTDPYTHTYKIAVEQMKTDMEVTKLINAIQSFCKALSDDKSSLAAATATLDLEKKQVYSMFNLPLTVLHKVQENLQEKIERKLDEVCTRRVDYMFQQRKRKFDDEQRKEIERLRSEEMHKFMKEKKRKFQEFMQGVETSVFD